MNIYVYVPDNRLELSIQSNSMSQLNSPIQFNSTIQFNSIRKRGGTQDACHTEADWTTSVT